MNNLSINEDWLVGFTDGEGCFHLQKVGKYRLPVFVIGCIDKEILEAIKEFLGCGKVYLIQKQGPKKIGIIYHHRVHRNKDVISKIIPFFTGKLIVKKEQFDKWASYAVEHIKNY